MSNITTIALTGGPCGGKSTSISVLEQELTNKGYQVFVVEEMATNLILSGANPSITGLFEFQRMLIKLQDERNKVYHYMADEFNDRTGKPVVIIFDRGIPDSKAYIGHDDYSKLLKQIWLSEVDVMDYYDGVFHLVTAADGAIEAYTCANNAARTETPEQAIALDKKCIEAWTGHSHLRVIKNGCTFEEKINNLLEEVYTLLGVPVPMETERKYLIEIPDFEELSNTYKGTTVDIIQTYLVEKEPGVERRIRQRGTNGSYTFYYTEKQKINDVSRTEKERKISEAEYLKLMLEADTSLHQIRKTRTCFVSDGTYFELDVYPFWNDKAVLEIELTNESKEISIPNIIKVIKEVTEDDRYKNRALAENRGKIE